MKIVVTGGAGLIGRFVVDRFARSGHHVVAVVHKPSGPSVEGLERAATEVIGDISDVDLVNSVMPGIDSVVHLAAISSPPGHTARELLMANTITTITVLEAAATHGVKSVVMASSISVLGMAWSETPMSPLYVPVDEAHPLRPTEGYALSKEQDEATARMANRRWNLPIVAMRFPFTATAEMIETRRADQSQREALAQELWAYLHVDDAARACELAVHATAAGALRGCSLMNIIADDVLLDDSLSDLLATWHPGVDFDPAEYPFRGAYDVSVARDLIGFDADYLLHDPI